MSWWSVLITKYCKYYTVLQGTTRYYTVLLQYYSVLQSPTPVLQSTTKYYSSTALYYKVLLQYYPVLLQYYSVLQSTTPVLQSTTPVLLCTTKCYSSTTIYIGATGVIVQSHRILSLPRKMTLMIDARRIWNVIYNARSDRCHQPTSPSTVPAAKNDSHHWSSCHIKRHLQCAEQQDSPSNLTKHCACHEKWLTWLILVTDEMCRATGITLQPHEKVRLPRQTALQNLRGICRKQLKRHLECADDSTMIRPWSEHEIAKLNPPVRRAYFSPLGNAFCSANYNISRSGYLAKFHRILRLPRKVTLQHHQMLCLPRKVTLQHHQILCLPRKVSQQHHQMLRLPRKMTRMIDLRHIWNLTEQQDYPPTSPITAPATQNCTPKSKRNLPKTVAASFRVRDRSEHDPNPIRTQTRHLAPARSPRLLFVLRRRILYWKLQRFALRLSTQISPNTAPATKSDTPTSPNAVPATKSDTELLLSWTVTWLHSYFTALMLYWTFTWLNCYFTELYWGVTLLSCYLTELLLYWAVTLVNCYFSELLLDWAVTLLSCYFTELLLYWSVTPLRCYFTELLLYWSVTLLSCYYTELLLYWAVTLPSCYFTGLFAFLNLRNSEVSHLNFLW